MHVTLSRVGFAWAFAAGAATTSLFPRAVAAREQETPTVTFHADEVKLDAKTQSLDVAGHVSVDEPPFHLRSEALTMRQVPLGFQLDGQGSVTFCPCLGTPLAIGFSAATVAPPHDLILRNPVVSVFGLPVAWAPAVWLRSPARVGLLPPDVAWRGADGFFAGGGVHAPWRDGDASQGIDLRAGGYAVGGVAASASLRTTRARVRVGWDRLRGDDGLALDGAGATGSASQAAAWEVDALRGARAVRATTDVDAAARPFDRAAAAAAWRPAGWTLSSGVRTVARRGARLGEFGVGGPVVAARRSDGLGDVGTYDATVEGGQVAGDGLGAVSFGRAEGGLWVAKRVSAIGTALSLRGIADVMGGSGGGGTEGAAQARVTVGLPLVRAFSAPADAPGDPWVHRTEPLVQAAALLTRSRDSSEAPMGGRGLTAPRGAGWVAAAGWKNVIGRWGARSSAELDATFGAIGDDRNAYPALRGRAAIAMPWTALYADVARVGSPAGSASHVNRRGGAFVGQARFGPDAGGYLSVQAAERDGIDPVVARNLVDPTIEPSSGFLATPGWTGGVRVGVPLGSRVRVRGGADIDLDARELVAAVGTLELHDPCNCVVVRAHGAHRVGRDGVDVWVSIDLPSLVP